ncbi:MULTISPECIES: hypothetical protein [unclassified Pseudomonas]|uniref:hypothetical protein n=1 Tax=unclassified Pseudomonas TaxID=196821 RepID=UPI00076CDE56|nr:MULTISPECIES: hypothetical protein [unclassified Pseudomonas]KVV04316.1 hypothetical protein AP060_02472 [Pseudomonas sp. TAD18]KVV05850.1 hypothetical protein AP059_02545 [Pseudomonas sp. TAA207]
MSIPIPAETPDPNIDDPVLPPGEPQPVPEEDPPIKDPVPQGDPPSETPPIKANRSI